MSGGGMGASGSKLKGTTEGEEETEEYPAQQLRTKTSSLFRLFDLKEKVR
jgi:hypothetical protein